MTYEDFYDIAEYGNENWKGSYTPKEVAVNAFNYFVNFKACKAKGELSYSIVLLMQLLFEDNSDECKYWFDQIANGTVMADIKTSPCDGLRMETIVWTKINERERFLYNGYTLFYDERIKNTKPFEEIK